MSDLLIRNCSVLQCETPQTVSILENHDISVSRNHIAAVRPTGQLNPKAHRKVLDAGGLVAMPGLINTHAHVPMVIFRGLAEDVNLETWFNEYMWPLESNLEEDDVYRGMLLGLCEMIECGITAVADHYFHMDRAAAAVEQAGTRAGLGWAIFGNQGKAMLDRAAAFARDYRGEADGRIQTWMAPHAPYTCDDDFLRATADWAEKLDLGIHIHAAETKEQTEKSLAARGKTPVQVLKDAGILDCPTLLAHCCGATGEDIALMAQHPCGVAHAPKTYMKLSMGAAPVPEFLKANIPVGLATDGAVSNNTLDVWESMRLMPLIQKHETGKPEALNVAQTLHIATRSSARVFGRADDLGHVAQGTLADIILVNLSGPHCQPLHDIPATLVYAARPTDVDTVIVNGKILMQNRRLLTLDREEIVNQVNRSMARLARRVPEARIQFYSPDTKK